MKKLLFILMVTFFACESEDQKPDYSSKNSRSQNPRDTVYTYEHLIEVWRGQ